MAKPRRRRLHRVFVRPGAQFKLFAPFLVFMLVWTSVMLIVAWVFHGAIDKLAAPAASLTAEDVGNLQMLNKNLVHILLGGSAASVVLSFVFWLSFSHNVFGPMVQIHRQIDLLKEGELGGEVRLRARDEFQGVAKSVNELTEKLKASKTS